MKRLTFTQENFCNFYGFHSKTLSIMVPAHVAPDTLPQSSQSAF